MLATPLASLLGIPAKRGALAAQKRGAFEFDGVLVEKWLFTA